jgi:hypothetical protein
MQTPRRGECKRAQAQMRTLAQNPKLAGLQMAALNGELA